MNRAVPSNPRWLPDWLHPAPDSLWRQTQRTSSNPRLTLFNLLWSAWVFATPLFTTVSAAFWWSLAVGYPLFLALFVLLHVRPNREAPGYVGALAALAFVSMIWNPSGWTYGVFACVYAGLTCGSSLRVSIAWIATIQVVLVVWGWWLGWPWFVMLMAVGVCSSAGFGAMFGHREQLKNAQLRMSNEEVRRLAASSERERIGRDLHDLLGHTLSLITLKLELSRKLFDRDRDAARRELAEAESVARHALAEVRSAVTGIRAAGLAAELASAKLLLHSSQVEFDYEQQAVQLSHTAEGALSLVLREAVTNIHRHARATHAEVSIRAEDGGTLLSIRDNGRGGVALATGAGNGLSGMRERLHSLHGRLEINSPPGEGTTLRAWLPAVLPHNRDAATETADRGTKPPAATSRELAGSRT